MSICILPRTNRRRDTAILWMRVAVAALGLLGREPTCAADGSPGLNSHNHGTNLAVYVEYRTNYLRLHYPVQANTTCVLQYLPVAIATNYGANMLTAPWANLPGTQAPRLPAGFPFEMRDYSITNRHSTNLGRIYRLKVT